MNKTSTLTIISKLKRLKKPGDHFTVKDHKERQLAINHARELRKYGLMSFPITTREIDNGFRVMAI